MIIESENYRPCVGAMILNTNGLVWVGKRISKVGSINPDLLWQMPQGGIEINEEPEQAVYREILEETGISSVNIKCTSSNWYQYKLPKDILDITFSFKYVGQTQKWFLLEFEGKDTEINIIPPTASDHKQEFSEWKWIDPKDLVNIVVPFKIKTYKNVINEFKDTLRL